MDEFISTLEDFSKSKLPISASKIQGVATSALSNANQPREVSLKLIDFFDSCKSEYKLACLYTVDAICKGIKKEKISGGDALLKEIELNLKTIVANVAGYKKKDKPKIEKLLNIWRKKVFNESIIDEILSKLDRLETLAPEKETSGKSENHIAVNSLNTSASNQEVPALLNDPASLFATLSELGKMTGVTIPSINPVAPTVNPLIFDYGDDDEDELTTTTGTEKALSPVAQETMNTLAHIQQLADSLKASQPPPVKTPVLPANQLGFPLQNPTQFFQGSNQAQQHFNVPNVFPNLSFPGQPNQFPNQMNNFNNPSPIRERPADEVNDSHRSKRSRFDDNDRKMSSHSNNSMPLNLSAKPTFPTRVHGPDSSIDIHHIRILSRTLYVGGIQATTSIEMLRPFFENYNIETIILHRGKFNGFVKLHTREDAEKAKNELSSHAQIDGVPLKINWGCGFGPKEHMDRFTGVTVAPISAFTESDQRFITVEIGTDFLNEHNKQLNLNLPKELKESVGISQKSDGSFDKLCIGGLFLEEPTTMIRKPKDGDPNVEMYVADFMKMYVQGNENNGGNLNFQHRGSNHSGGDRFSGRDDRDRGSSNQFDQREEFLKATRGSGHSGSRWK